MPTSSTLAATRESDLNSVGAQAGTTLLDVRELVVHFRTRDGGVKAVDGLSYTLHEGETLAIVGESGSGKSVSCLTMLGLTSHASADISGQALYRGANLLTLRGAQLRQLRGNEISMIFQDPFASLHPLFRVSDQLVEAIRAHDDVSRRAARERVAALLERVGIPTPRERMDDYPHQYSGGMRQRVMIAMALINSPRVLIADEPTTALDVTVQAQILELIEEMKAEFSIGVILITHDLGVVREVAQNVLVMYAGRAVEHGPTESIFAQPSHPYTRALLDSVPRLDGRGGELTPIDGQPPSLIFLPRGCAFHPRCRHRFDRCEGERPELDRDAEHAAACHLSAGQRRELLSDRREQGAEVGA